MVFASRAFWRQNKTRISSSNQNPVGSSDTTGEITGENDRPTLIFESLQEIKRRMATDLCGLVKNISSKISRPQSKINKKINK